MIRSFAHGRRSMLDIVKRKSKDAIKKVMGSLLNNDNHYDRMCTEKNGQQESIAKMSSLRDRAGCANLGSWWL